MTHRFFCTHIVIILLILLLAPAAAHSDGRITIGILAFRPKEQIQREFQPVAEYLQRSLHNSSVVIKALSYNELEKALEQHTLDFILTNPGHYTKLRGRNRLSGAIATMIEREGSHSLSSMGGVIITRSERVDIEQIADLKGKRIAAVSAGSLGGYQAQAFEALQVGVHLPQDASVTFTDTPHDRAMRLLLAGKVDAVFVRTGMIEKMAREGTLDPKTVKVINRQESPGFPLALSTRLYPQWPFIALPHVPERLARRVAAALLTLDPDKEKMPAGICAGFTIPADYQAIELLLRELRLPPFDSAPSFTMSDVWGRYNWWIIGILSAASTVTLLSMGLAASNRKLAAARADIDRERLQLRTLIDAMPDMVCFKDGKGRWLEANQFDLEVFRLSGIEYRGKTGAELARFSTPHRDALMACEATDEAAWQAGAISRFEEMISLPDGRSLVFDIIKIPTFESDGSRKGIIVVGRDISHRKQAEERLRQSEEKFSAAFKISPDSIHITRLDDGIFLEVNEGFTSLLGYSAEEVVGTSAHSLEIWDDPEDRERLACQLREQGNVNNLEAKLRRKDGTVLTALVSSRIVEIEKEPCSLNIVRDITEREILQKELGNTQRLESLGVLAGGIAHDFNNILTGIMGNIQLAMVHIDTAHNAHGFLTRAETASLRAADLSKKLLVFSKGGLPIKKMVSLRLVVHEALSLALTGTNVKGVLSIPVPVQTIEADEGQINQAFHNIIINAVHAMPDGGILAVHGENVVVDNNKLGLCAGTYVKLSFTDEGCGISEQDQKKIFDPYFTTKANGTGLGLASTYAIVKNHGGKIVVDSAIGVGTTFTMYLPSSGEIHSNDRPENEGTLALRGCGSILVMDDEEMVRDIATKALEHFGYTVRTCTNGEEAISLYTLAHEAGTPFSIVIMDITIPGGMGGVEAARHILDYDPKAALIVSSGYSANPVMANFKEYGFCSALEKPYKARDLARMLTGVAMAAR